MAAKNKVNQDEEIIEAFHPKQLLRLMGYIKPYKNTMILVCVLMLLAGIINIVNPFIIQMAIDDLIPSSDKNGIITMSVMLAVLYAVSSLITRYKIVTMNRVGQSIINSLRLDIFSHLQTLPFSYFDARPHGKILIRVVQYVNSLSDLLSNGLINTITNLFDLIIIMVVMFAINPKLACVGMIPLPVFVFMLFAMKRSTYKRWQRHSSKNSNLTAYIQESISGIRVTQSFAREKRNRQIFHDMAEECRSAWMSAQRLFLVVGATVDTAQILAACLLCLYGIPRLGEGVTIGVLTQFTIYITIFWTPIINLANQYNALTTATAYIERIYELIDEKPAVRDIQGAVPMKPIEGNVSFQNVRFEYEPNNPVLKNLSFDVEKGQTIALVGPTGAGKTTIINLLSRFYNLTSGTIYIDGQDISKVTLSSLRRQMGVMLQDTFIFAGTIEDNIRYSKPEATDEEIRLAAKTVCADEFIKQMENGYDTEVNERGTRLSAGQRQLISFARALLADPKILILDEATANIDTETETLLQKGLDELLKGRTAFIIAHRLSTIKNADRIMYIDRGGIIESGTHDELMQKQGAYYNLYTAQYLSISGLAE